MWEMAQTSIGLFFQGRLFANPQTVYRRLAIGVALTAIILIVLAVISLPLWLAAVVAGLVGGAAQPYLFKDLRYR